MTNNFEEHIKANNKEYNYFSIQKLAKNIGKDISKLPFSLKVLLENILRSDINEDKKLSDCKNIIDSVKDASKRQEIFFSPSRVLMQDFTGVPAVVDLAAMRDAVVAKGGDAKKINPLIPVDLVIDHSIQVDFAGSSDAAKKNVDLEMQRNKERYEFLKWAQKSFDNFRAVPPGAGICHQVNVENLARVTFSKEIEGKLYCYPDTVVGTDSHTTMVNGLSVLGWGVGGIEAEAAMLGQSISMLIPEVIGFKLTGKLNEGVTATDLVLNIVNILREKKVVGKFVEFYGDALNNLSLANRATIANMAPEYGATCGIFAIDDEVLNYLKLTGRSDEQIELVEKYAKEEKFFRDNIEPEFSDIVELDISSIKATIAGPKRPQDKIELSNSKAQFKKLADQNGANLNDKAKDLPNLDDKINHGDVVIAAITSCTNTSNPSVLIAAALVAKKAVEKGLKIRKTVKTSFAPGSQVVAGYLKDAGLQEYLDKIGFNIVGFGCTTCIGNSGDLKPEIHNAIKDNNLLTTAVLSGNRNFEGRVHPLTKGNYLASPPLVVAYALAGTMNIDLENDIIAKSNDGSDVYLKDLWPTDQEIEVITNQFVNKEIFIKKYADLFAGDAEWQKINVTKSDVYSWNKNSTYIRLPNFFESKERGDNNIKNAKIIALLGDSITTDHISPAGNIAKDSPAAKYLEENGVEQADFNSYGSRRGNYEVMTRGTFANIRIKNEILDNVEGGYSKNNAGEVVSIYDAAMEAKNTNQPLVVIAGKEYGTGSSRDWAAKGTNLLGIKAVIAESFERIHRSNLIGMGVLPLMFKDGQSRKSLGLTGEEKISINIGNNIAPKDNIKCQITRKDGSMEEIDLLSRIDTENEVKYYKAGGILN
ncbi:aconitate hydratase AcnA, partial [Rickettsiales bacterium]|nr:aconitate hydratase AcnA [Rickettsiales bacterium]